MTLLRDTYHGPAGGFRPRQRRFEPKAALARDWHGGSAFRTAWFNAMSMLFPLGEKFFIDSVRAYSDRIEEDDLRAEVRAFQGQESVHRREHQRYNEALCEARAHDLLSHDDVLAGADPEIAELWRWHAVEETEHKAVAFDVHELVGGTVKERRHALVMSSLFFLKDTFRNARIMLKRDGQLWRWRTWRDGFQFLFGRPGTLRRIVPAWFSFLRRGFHPWQHDNSELVARYELARKG